MLSRASRPNISISNDSQRSAYLAVRLPATYAAVFSALRFASQSCAGESRRDSHRARSRLWSGNRALGGHPVFPSIGAATGFERDARMIEIAHRLGQSADQPAMREAAWMQGDLTASLPEGPWDLVVCSYALNELREAQRAEFVRQAWARTGKLLVIVEPGTKAGFANVLAVRTRLLQEGATLAAPCPHALACPMAQSGDWCHFAARVERTAEHRRLKHAVLGHEDEKFSYAAFSRDPQRRRAGSASAHRAPSQNIQRLHAAHAMREGEIVNTTVTRSKKEDWRRLKRLGWGDAW